MTKRRVDYVELPSMGTLMSNAMKSQREIQRLKLLEKCDRLVYEARMAVNRYVEASAAGQTDAFEASEKSDAAYQKAFDALNEYNKLYPAPPKKTWWQRFKEWFTADPIMYTKGV